MSRGQSLPGTHSGRRTLERCRTKGKSDNIVYIDVDGDVIVVDVPESLQHTLQGSRKLREDKKLPPPSIIRIDDDSPGNGVEGGHDLDSDATSSKGSRPASSQSRNCVESDGDECQLVEEIKFPSKLSRYKYSRKMPSRNRYGLNPVSASSSSECDTSDCELMEDSFGKFREQWVKAYLRKKMFKDVLNGQSGPEDRASSSGPRTDSEEDVEVDNTANQHPEGPVPSSSSNGNDEKENLTTFTVTGDGIVGDTSLKPEGKSSFADLDQTVDQENFSWCKTSSWEKTQSTHRKASVQDRGNPSFSVSHGGPTCRDEEQISQGEQQFNYVKAHFQGKEENTPGEACFFNAQSGHDEHSDHSKASFQYQEASLFNIRHLDETQVHDKTSSRYNDEGILREKKKPVSREPSLFRSRPCDETQVNHGVACSEDKVGPVSGETFFCNTQLRVEIEANHEKASCQDKGEPVSEGPCLYNTHRGETQMNHRRGCFKEVKEPVLESMSNTQPQDERSSLSYALGRDGPPDAQNDMVVEREKLKETDEYKRAAEEEWASRQRQLQIQAEEVQRLRKRKRAQTMRLLDMERRQKQRVEEMRETQKKDEDTINLKEQLRVEVRNELDKLEVRCTDMASLLRGLGIHVGGGICPFPSELSLQVHAAYKQALLRFHPDRASRTDIYQQVEAEEKFKLISRVKEKLLSRS
ncbi:hypothetical protein HHK36_015531 [Tetracentron sinense]|uniref:J domain-containing protein n=1 Tax=Tetracentron sinense TaxID=13715 RepID=A0A835DDY8_TETSI|nr:hypothetical protein HHK36_015531 [Tetracentron sinense]